MKAKAEVEEEVANLKSELKALRADVKTKAMKAWPVNPFVPTSLSLSSRVVFFHEVSLVLPSADLSISIPGDEGPKAMKAMKAMKDMNATWPSKIIIGNIWECKKVFGPCTNH